MRKGLVFFTFWSLSQLVLHAEAPHLIPTAALVQIQADASSPPIHTAGVELASFLKKHGSPEVRAARGMTAGTICLGTTAESEELARWAKEGRLGITASGSASDAYEIAVLDGCVVVNGASPRAVLYGTFELEDLLARQGGLPSDLHVKAAPSLGLRLLHPRFHEGNKFASYRQSDFEFIARCGGNVAHLMHDWMPEKTLFSFVPSTAFPKAADAEALDRNRARLGQYLEWCRLYGLDGAMWLCEIPCQGGPWVPAANREAFLNRFPADCLSDTGTYQGKVPCLAHPLVEQEYRRMVRQLLTDFPGISMVLVFTLDSGGELCDPATCPRHHGVSKLEQYNRLLALTEEEGRKVRPGFQVFSVGWSWKFRGEPDYFSRQAALPAGIGLATLPDAEAWSFDRKTTSFLEQSRSGAGKHQQTFLGYDLFFWGDDTVFGPIKDSRLPLSLGATKLYDFPLGIAAKLRRWQGLHADGFFDQWGTAAEYIQCNAVALRELVFHPENNTPGKVQPWAKSLAARRFGDAVATPVLDAWQEIEAAQQIQSDHTWYWHHLRPAWAGPVLKSPLTVDALQQVTLSGGEPSKLQGDRDLSPYHDDVARATALAPALEEAAAHFGKALAHLQGALSLVKEGPSPLDHWYEAAPGGPARLTSRQVLEEEITAVRLQEQCQRRMSRFFRAFALVKTLPADPTQREAALKILEQLRLEDQRAGR